MKELWSHFDKREAHVGLCLLSSALKMKLIASSKGNSKLVHYFFSLVFCLSPHYVGPVNMQMKREGLIEKMGVLNSSASF